MLTVWFDLSGFPTSCTARRVPAVRFYLTSNMDRPLYENKYRDHTV